MILLDTHVLLWMWERPTRISQRASREIARSKVILVSTISFYEVARLSRLNRITLDRSVFDWIRELLADERMKETPLTLEAAVSAGLLGEGFPGDPYDRLLYTTARELAVPFISKDGRIRDFARESRDVKVIW